MKTKILLIISIIAIFLASWSIPIVLIYEKNIFLAGILLMFAIPFWSILALICLFWAMHKDLNG